MMGLLGAGKVALAQRTGGAPVTTQPTPNKPVDTAAPPFGLPQAGPPPTSKETKAIKSFRDVAAADLDKKMQVGEDFINKYPQSSYRPEVVSWLANAYMTKGQVDKLLAEGDKELAFTPNSAQSLAILGSDLARALNGDTPDKEKNLTQAETYCRKSLEALAAMKKPDDLTGEKFTAMQNPTAALAHSGLGTVAMRRGKYAEAIPELQRAVALSGTDPVDYYLLGKANEAMTHYDDAVAAFTKCAAMPGAMQAACQSSIGEAKGLAGSAPK